MSDAEWAPLPPRGVVPSFFLPRAELSDLPPRGDSPGPDPFFLAAKGLALPPPLVRRRCQRLCHPPVRVRVRICESLQLHDVV